MQAKIQDGVGQNTQGTPQVGPEGTAEAPKVEPVKVQVGRNRPRREAKAPEQPAGHEEKYGDGRSTAAGSRPAAGAAGAQIKARGRRPSDEAMALLKTTLQMTRDTPRATVQADIAIPGGSKSAARALEAEFCHAMARSKTLHGVAKLSSAEAVSYIGIAIAVIRAVNELMPELIKLVGHLKDLWSKIKNKQDSTVQIGDNTYTIQQVLDMDPAVLARTLAPSK